ncbi:NAD(P)-dependent oxidoreductase [Piscinibacter sp. HJYY11]|uniref:NAD(P)-dependent oxidoreductase n=1 Tax=Piscinibacter sp. HJYY11 TaxID=2801333 RepID=UPI00191CBCA5|nr:NAD(P)-binding domain-containing protein [Piscinibacter sp. HJYY11]MBL0727338.1 NAD(P)-dependent oxidoreductase [Piscinibacter sp. HJYY11]
MSAVTVIGLGAMGATLASLFRDKGREVTVWNRSPAKAAGLEGVATAPTAAAAVAASPLVVMCVYDYVAVREILAQPGVADALAGKTLVQLTTGSPADARDAAAWCAAHGVAYLDGAIQAAPSQMGQPDTPILISGDPAAFAQWQGVLADLGGHYAHLGEQPDAAATMDLATLSYVYGAFIGFAHGALIAESQGLDVARFGQLVQDISPSFGAFFAFEGQVIQSGDFTMKESPLRISVEATQRIHEFSREARLNTELPELADRLLKRAQAAGLANEELAALIKVMRR